jgi:hypothetical protein
LQVWLEEPAGDDPIELLASYRQWIQQDRDEFRAELATMSDGVCDPTFAELAAELSGM